MSTEKSPIIEAITCFLVEAKEKGEHCVKVQEIVDNFQNDIVSDCRVADVISVKASWIRNISRAAESLGLTVASANNFSCLCDKAKVSWKSIERLSKDTHNATSSNQNTNIRPEQEANASASPTPAPAPSSSSALASPTPAPSSSSLPSSSNSLPSLKTEISPGDKANLQHGFAAFKRKHQNDFWILNATRERARDQNIEPLSVEEKVMDFALSCEFYHPSQSLIVDLGDSNWLRVFTEEELDELREAGDDMDFSAPKELEQNFQEILKLKDSTELFNYARSIPIVDPSKETLKVWLSIELQNIAQLFLETGSFDVSTMMETDQLHLVFGFLSSVVRRSDIVVKGTEGSSEANADALNNDRQLSSVKPIAKRKMGRRGDLIFESGKLELGCTEIGAAKDQTKEMRDSLLKLPIVLRDMLLLATFSPSLLHKCHVVGYSISGGSVSLMDVDIPKGFVTRVRRTEQLDFPENNKTLMTRILPLLNLACVGKKIMEKTLDITSSTMRPLSLSSPGKNHWCLPPNFVPSPKSPQKRQRTD
ncbi:hypothetical protein BDB00DRAFT_927974 [Zychaea mexicana]|uniref:uncharacterized protein n=1 Tax=Zychaea mexicana TaxID=64656 RepID=UPI0022FE3997|nr:uncharacterized protein BDB00DRAFT_927974 [Zychaea mexicana]KAI9494784.1 hypothetical protein BDB00DRAFT_927974 [Zychaea mexicana]